MYFVHTESLELVGINDPERYLGRYAIFSHCWGEEEVQFGDMQVQSHHELEKRIASPENSLKGKSGAHGHDAGDEVALLETADFSL